MNKKEKTTLRNVLLVVGLIVLLYFAVQNFQSFAIVEIPLGEWFPESFDGSDLIIPVNIVGSSIASNEVKSFGYLPPTSRPILTIGGQENCEDIGWAWNIITPTQGFCTYTSNWNWEDWEFIGTCKEGAGFRFDGDSFGGHGKQYETICTGKIIVHINERPQGDLTVYRFENNQCTELTIPSTDVQANDFGTLQDCENLIQQEIPDPPENTPFWRNVLDRIKAWFDSIFEFFFSITGDLVVEPGTTHTYQIDMISTIPDTDFSDGLYERDMASWSLVDKDGNILQEGPWEEVFGSYQKSVTINIPAEPSSYALISVIYRYSMEYVVNVGWQILSEEVIEKEALNIATEIPAPPEVNPVWQSILDFFQPFIDWIKGLFGG